MRTPPRKQRNRGLAGEWNAICCNSDMKTLPSIFLCAIMAAVLFAETAPLRESTPAIKSLGSKYEAQRKSAAESLVKTGPSAIDGLLPLLESKNYFERKNAAEIIAELAAESASGGHAPAIAEKMTRFLDREPEIAAPLMRALARIEGAKAIPRLRPAIDPPQVGSARVRATAVMLLASLGDKESAQKIAALLNDEFSEVRAAAADALGTLKARKYGEAVFAAFEREKIIRAKIAMIRTLGEVQYSIAVLPLIALLRDEAGPLFPPAVNALTEIKTDRARDALINLLMDSDDFEMLDLAARAVATYGSSALPVLKSRLNPPEADASTDDRKCVLQAYSYMGPKAIPHIIDFMAAETYPLWQGQAHKILRAKVKKYYNEEIDWELRHHDPVETRLKAVRRWQEWWKEKQEKQ